MKMKQIQQGDVLLKRVSMIPAGAVKKSHTHLGYVLAEGEVTGHAHCIEEIDGCELYEKDGIMYISASKTVSLVHEEHKSVTIESGIWQVGIIQEYDPWTEEIRNVQD